VFTCLYIHNPDFIEDPAMKAFALGILKICDIAREKVNKAAVFEEVKKHSGSLASHCAVGDDVCCVPGSLWITTEESF
jgi:hypothetical protein